MFDLLPPGQELVDVRLGDLPEFDDHLVGEIVAWITHSRLHSDRHPCRLRAARW